MSLSHSERKARRASMLAEISGGLSMADAARKYGLNPSYVRSIAAGLRTFRTDGAMKREAALRELHSLKMSQSRCAALMRLSAAAVSKMARRVGLKFSKAWCRVDARADANKGRVVVMAALYRDGYTLEQIGTQYGISRERVRQLMTKHLGISHADGGQHQLAERRRAKVASQRDGACLKKYGCTFSQWQELRDFGRQMKSAGAGVYRTPLGAYRSQRRNAFERGIGWKFTLWQWWQVWQQSGLWAQRGRGQGYVMRRIGDLGDYEPGNVFIGKATENSSEGRGKNNPLPMGVRATKSGRYVVHRTINGVKLRLGTHDTPDLAYAAYLMAGEQMARAA